LGRGDFGDWKEGWMRGLLSVYWYGFSVHSDIGLSYILYKYKWVLEAEKGGERKKMRLKNTLFPEKVWVFGEIKVFLQLHHLQNTTKTQINNLNS